MRGSSRLNVVVFGGRACKFNSDYLNKLITNWHFFFFLKYFFQKQDGNFGSVDLRVSTGFGS